MRGGVVRFVSRIKLTGRFEVNQSTTSTVELREILPEFDASGKSDVRKRKRKGYSRSHLDDDTQAAIREFRKPVFLRNIVETIGILLSIAIAAAAVVGLSIKLPLYDVGLGFHLAICLVAYLVAAVFIARQQRALENKTHDASHGNWNADRVVNNRWANLLAAHPVLSTIDNYWSTHGDHHGSYGSDKDPCRARFERMGLKDLDLSSRTKIALAVLRWLPTYNYTYYQEVGSIELSVWRNTAIWHLVAIGCPTLLALLWAGTPIGQAASLVPVLWVFFWVLPALVVLPVIRSIAESEEHDYERGETEFETTYTNIGFWQRWLFHPANDGFHLIHHMYPTIPTCLHHKVHEVLMKHDEKYRRSLIRTSVLEEI